MPLQDLLESMGHQVRWDSASADGPTASSGATDLVILDAEISSCVQASEAWRNHDPPPGVLLIGRSESARQRSMQARSAFAASNSAAAEFDEEIRHALALRFAGRMSGPFARAVLYLGSAVGPKDDAVRIIQGSRGVDLEMVRECLRWRAYEYVTATDLIASLREERALTIPEIEVIQRLDGTLTVQRVVSSATDGVLAGRLLWGLLSSGAAHATKGPPDLRTPARRMLNAARQHLLARHQRLQNATHYDVLEVPRDARAELVDYAARTLAVRYAPDRLAAMDMGELGTLVAANWQQILVARAVLMSTPERAKYEQLLAAQGTPGASWAQISDPTVAEEFFRRGQAALVAGEASKAVSAIAGACRNHPDHPTYEAYLCWARFRAEVDRGGEREALVGKERKTAEEALIGRRPWPPALIALALLCAADNDPDSARFHLSEALAVDPKLPLAKQLMSRFGAS